MGSSKVQYIDDEALTVAGMSRQLWELQISNPFLIVYASFIFNDHFKSLGSLPIGIHASRQYFLHKDRLVHTYKQPVSVAGSGVCDGLQNK
eukprot:12427625-Karenia_brevis.AAC.1